MVKEISDGHCFNSSWMDTVEGAIHKYPNNINKNIASVDILEREIDSNGNLVTKKLMRSHFRPNWGLKKVMGVLGMPARTHQLSVECSNLDLARKSFRLRSLNKTYFNFISCYESLHYTPDTSDPVNKTHLAQQALIDMYVNDYNFSLRWAVNQGEEKFASEYKQTAKSGRVGLEGVIKNLQREWQEFEDALEKTGEEVEELTKKCFETGVDCAKEMQQITSNCAKEMQQVTGKIVDESSKIVDESTSKVQDAVIQVIHKSTPKIDLAFSSRR